MSNSSASKPFSWAVLDRFMRSVHLYTGLLLAPWMAVYALSGLLLNHGQWINKTFQLHPPQWEPVRTVDFQPGPDFPRTREEQARALLQFLDLAGPHVLQGKPNDRELVILRIHGRGNYRIVWRRDLKQVRVQQQRPPSWIRFTHFLHFRHGYQQADFTYRAWAFIVDGVVVSILFWIGSGIYLWARRPTRRRLGLGFLIGGIVLFVWLAWQLW